MANSTVKAPLGATHIGHNHRRGCDTYYKYEGGVWTYWSYAYDEWRDVDNNEPTLNPIPLMGA